jgi:hypothetical protein
VAALLSRNLEKTVYCRRLLAVVLYLEQRLLSPSRHVHAGWGEGEWGKIQLVGHTPLPLAPLYGILAAGCLQGCHLLQVCAHMLASGQQLQEGGGAKSVWCVAWAVRHHVPPIDCC